MNKNTYNLPALSNEGGLAAYLAQIKKFPMLAAEEEYMLAKNWQSTGNVKSAEKLVTSHLRLVAKIAMGYKGYGLPLNEMISEGNVGLMQAVKKFEPEKGFRLATYAMWWIKASIQEYILRSWSLVKIGTTTAQKKLFFNLKKIKNQIAPRSEGDLRKGFNFIETIVEALPQKTKINEEHVAGFCKERSIRYDRDEDEHYNTASAFIKSMRGNDPDAAIYWLAKMLAGGEDPRFIARRLVIFASEDVGLADSRALLMADATFRACETIGLPECELNLAHATLFLATCPKSNSATLAISKAKQAIQDSPVQSVPSSIQDRHGRNKNHRDVDEESYLYSHDFPENISGQQYLQKPLDLYHPKNSGAESAITERLAKWKKLRRKNSTNS